MSEHYSGREDSGRGARSLGDGVVLRKFNNWVKAVLMLEFAQSKDGQRNLVLDICCGKGGDLNKWNQHHPAPMLVVMADGAHGSVEDARKRYNQVQRPWRFSVRFISADCFRFRLASIPGALPENLAFDSVSCQFALHYCFESRERAMTMLRNVSERLRKEGNFIGTIPDANVLVRNARERANPDKSFGNAKFNVRFAEEYWKDGKLLLPDSTIFGIKYWFMLNDAVDCPEFLVHFPSLEKLAKEFGLELIYRANFHEFYLNYGEKHSELMMRMVFGRHGMSRTNGIPHDEWEIACKQFYSLSLCMRV